MSAGSTRPDVPAGDALELGRGLPGWLPRAVVAAAAGGIVAVLMANGIEGAALGFVVLAVVMSVILPSSPAPTLVLVLVGLSVIVLGSNPLAAHVLALVALVHLFHVSCAIAGVLPASARVHLSALRRPAIRFLAIQAGVFAFAGLLALIPAGPASVPLEILALTGVTVVAGLIVWLLHRPQ